MAEIADLAAVEANELPQTVAEAIAGKVRHLPLRVGEKLTLSTGAVVDGISNGALTNFHFFYLTVVCGLSGSLASASVAIALSIDAVADPLIGSMSDNWNSGRGRRHPLMFTSVVPVALALGLTFSIPLHLSIWALFTYVTIVSVVYRVGSSGFTLPYAALVAEVTDNYVERSLLRIYGAGFTTFSGILVVALGYGIFMRDQDRLLHDAYIPFGWMCALLVLAAGLYCSFRTLPLRGRLHAVAVSPHSPRLRLTREIREIFLDRSFRIIFFTAFIWFIALGTAGTPALLSNTFFWRLPNSVILAAAAALAAGGFFGIFVSIAIASKFEKRTVLIGSLIVFVSLQFSLAPLRILGLLPPNGPALYALLIGGALLIGTVGACAGIFFWSMMGDATDEHELLFGARREGLYFSGMTFSAKAAAGAGVLIAGIGLDLVGFPHGAATLATAHLSKLQIDGLGLITGPLGAAITSISLPLVWGYRIDRKEHMRIIAALDERKRASIANT